MIIHAASSCGSFLILLGLSKRPRFTHALSAVLVDIAASTATVTSTTITIPCVFRLRYCHWYYLHYGHDSLVMLMYHLLEVLIIATGRRPLVLQNSYCSMTMCEYEYYVSMS